MTDPRSRLLWQHRLQKLYHALPARLQSAALSLEGWRIERERFGPAFRARLDRYLSLEKAPERVLYEVRRSRLRRILEHAAESIPYWKERFREARLDPEKVEGPEDLGDLPVLTKEDVLRLGDALISKHVPRSRIRWVHTSGTTGAGLVFPTTVDAIRDQWAVWWRYRIRFGIKPGTWCAVFGGRSICRGGAHPPPYWRVNLPGRQVFFSQYHLGPSTAEAYLEELERRALPWAHGYPSVLSLLSSLALDRGRRLRSFRFVTVGAENLLEGQRRAIREAFGVEPLQHYGLAEGVANASECPAGRLHVDEDFAAVELLPAEGGRSRIVGTSFENFALPFIRYDTGDLATVVESGCSCGLPGRVLEAIDGRQEDLVTLADGSRVGRLDHLFKDMVHIQEAQIRQRAPGDCVIAVVARDGYGPRDEQELLEACRERFGDRLRVQVERVASIPRTPSGKLRLVVSGEGDRPPSEQRP